VEAGPPAPFLAATYGKSHLPIEMHKGLAQKLRHPSSQAGVVQAPRSKVKATHYTFSVQSSCWRLAWMLVDEWSWS